MSGYVYAGTSLPVNCIVESMECKDDDMSMPPRKLDYFIVGTQKGGTTALFRKLCSNDQFFDPGKKELHFFDNENIDWSSPRYNRLHKHFVSSGDQTFIGEATPIYMYWPMSMERVFNYRCDAKIIIILRHPSFRALSHWKMLTTRGNETLSFTDAISEAGRNRVRSAGGYHRQYSYVERGFYSAQVEKILKLFDRQNVFFCTADELGANEVALVNNVMSFIGASPDYRMTGERIIKPVDSSHVNVDAEKDLAYLNGLYRSDIERTAALTGLNLNDWLDESFSGS